MHSSSEESHGDGGDDLPALGAASGLFSSSAGQSGGSGKLNPGGGPTSPPRCHLPHCATQLSGPSTLSISSTNSSSPESQPAHAAPVRAVRTLSISRTNSSSDESQLLCCAQSRPRAPSRRAAPLQLLRSSDSRSRGRRRAASAILAAWLAGRNGRAGERERSGGALSGTGQSALMSLSASSRALSGSSPAAARCWRSCCIRWSC